ncbi:MAG: hypothetical protein N4A74_20720 [Carboxylicivirga sp.]|jgi:hypothetical protein|nr:hypothetical protein [Carboxylicivirga sp.]
MKKRIKFLLFAGLTTIIFSACEKEDDLEGVDPEKTISVHGLDAVELGSGVMFQGNDFNVTNTVEYILYDKYVYPAEDGTLTNFVDEVVGYTVEGSAMKTGNFIVRLYEDGIVWDSRLRKSFGAGAAVSLQLASASIEDLLAGEYKYGENGKPNTFRGYASSNYNFNPTSSDEVTSPITLKGGSVRVEKNGNIYTIEFDCVTSIGSSVKGKYVGELGYENEQLDVDIQHLTNVYIESSCDTMHYKYHHFWDDGFDIWTSPDYIRPSSLYITADGKAINGKVANAMTDMEKKTVDLMCVYDKIENKLKITTPLEMRGIAWHGKYPDYYTSAEWLEVILPCHTKVNSTSGLSAEDFDNITSSADLDFDVVSDDYWLDLNENHEDRVIIFQTGNGIKGALKINSISPFIRYQFDHGSGSYSYPVNPRIDFEIKTMLAASSEKLK